MKNNQKSYRSKLLLLMLATMAFAATVRAQSTDMDAPTVLTSNVITGEGDGKGESLYYGFTATAGDLKVTVDAKTDKYSTPVEVTLLTEDGKQLLQVVVVAGDKMERKVDTKHFVREQKVILRINTREDNEVKLLTYKIKLDGPIKIDVPATGSSTPSTTDPASAAAAPTIEVAPTAAPEDTTPAVAASPAADAAATPQPSAPGKQPPGGTKEKIKDKVKAKAKDAVKKIVDSQ